MNKIKRWLSTPKLVANVVIFIIAITAIILEVTQNNDIVSAIGGIAFFVVVLFVVNFLGKWAKTWKDKV